MVMDYYMCEKCYKISKEKMTICPKCGATDSFVPPDQMSALWSPLGPCTPVGADTGGVMTKSYNEYLPALPILPTERKTESKRKRSRKD